jgi:hypothetical protein
MYEGPEEPVPYNVNLHGEPIKGKIAGQHLSGLTRGKKVKIDLDIIDSTKKPGCKEIKVSLVYLGLKLYSVIIMRGLRMNQNYLISPRQLKSMNQSILKYRENLEKNCMYLRLVKQMTQSVQQKNCRN